VDDFAVMMSLWLRVLLLQRPCYGSAMLVVMPFSTACSTSLTNVEAGLNYQDVDDPAVMVSNLYMFCCIFMSQAMLLICCSPFITAQPVQTFGMVCVVPAVTNYVLRVV
jgi:hypothetical protein